jgi:hypothetical protein
LGAALLIIATIPHANAQQLQIDITVDENGNGMVVATGESPITLLSALQADPGPGGLSSALTYSLISPPGLTEGDVLIDEPGGGLGDVVRFNPGETCVDGTTGCLVFYSVLPAVSLADTGLPSMFYTNTITLTEGLDGAVLYTPTSGEPGFVVGADGAPVNYDLISDNVPEPGSLAILAASLFGVGWLRRRRTVN